MTGIRLSAAVCSVVLGAAVVLASEPAFCAPLKRDASSEITGAMELSAQRRDRPRTRIIVRPSSRYPYRTFHSPYPLPYQVEYPGPGHVRECRANLVQEFRASGTVIVPRTTCWWVRG